MFVVEKWPDILVGDEKTEINQPQYTTATKGECINDGDFDIGAQIHAVHTEHT